MNSQNIQWSEHAITRYAIFPDVKSQGEHHDFVQAAPRGTIVVVAVMLQSPVSACKISIYHRVSTHVATIVFVVHTVFQVLVVLIRVGVGAVTITVTDVLPLGIVTGGGVLL